ncbi:zf-HC2 domain-containing protein [Streptomyces sp. TRM66268-LWL]|uniref:Zf-HC2 domain-containing protein n=1 Tax=Streptomyces polyasparticus TaxID=2767826 RepID=A0ABR7S726_9ACTN|nr:zf-HC2 domain-containing protein [Streptomyces polyasparticus]
MPAAHRGPQPWHLTDALVDGYATHSLAEPDAWSVETHVEVCGPCAARVSAAVRATDAGPLLAASRTALLGLCRTPAPHTGLPGLLPAPAARAELPGLPAPAPHTRRTSFLRSPASPTHRHRPWWSTGPALRGSWLASLLLLITAALALAYGTGVDVPRSALLALAPVLPVAAVAVSYGRGVDPLYEIAAASPRGGLRLLLTRTAVALAVCVPLLTVTGALLPAGQGGPAAAAWLLPGLALTLGTLALATVLDCRIAAAVTGTGWLLAVGLPALAARPPRDYAQAQASAHALTESLSRYVNGLGAQAGWALAAALCAGALALRRTAFDHAAFDHTTAHGPRA